MKRFLLPPALLILLITAVVSCSNENSIILLTPENGITLKNNMPTLTWNSVDSFSSFEIWIDGHKEETVSGDRNAYTAFPLSFGEHKWKVVGIKSDLNSESNVGTFTIDDSPLDGNKNVNSFLLRKDWKIISSELVNLSGNEISGKPINTTNWKTTSVPATVLTALVRNGVYPNPYVGFNNMYIPDCSDEFNSKYDLLKYSHIQGKNPWKSHYWFRHEFNIPDSIKGHNYWLNLGEINYRAEIWLNGIQIGGPTEIIGMERSFKFNISEILNKSEKNILAIGIYPPDHPGLPDPAPLETLGEPGENMGDGMISKDYTKWDVLGWDWQPAIRDRNMGITEDVYIQATDDIEIENLYVTSDMNLPDTSTASIAVSCDFVNHSSTPVEIIAQINIEDKNSNISFNQKVKVDANSIKSLIWSDETIKKLRIENPNLWWPVGYGNQNLYSLKIEASTLNGDKAVSQTHFGIRKVETYIGKNERIYKINGQKIYPKGGNWVLDMMLNWTASRYEDEILLTKNANLNLLRVWGPTGVPPTAFFDAADRHGILIWQDFLNDYWGTFKNKPGYLPNEKLFEAATTAIVKKHRNHPSLIIWCGGNEGPNPREKLIMEKILPTHDGRDSKHYLKISNGDGLHGGGPYHTLKPSKYFSHHQLHGFSSEIGPSGVPVFQSMSKFITDLGQVYDKNYFPLNGQWAYHDANDRSSDTRKFSSYDSIVRNCYGKPVNVEDYLEKCQMLNYDAYRASIESINHQLWENASGIALWKSNSSWPSITWQIYDWYLQAHAGFYGVKKASEPVHIQLNRNNMEVCILNSLHHQYNKVNLSATLLSEDLSIIWKKDSIIDLPKSNVIKTKWIVPQTEEVTFLKLIARNQSGQVLSENFYWLSSSDEFTSLRKLKEAQIETNVSKNETRKGVTYTISFKNSGKGIALMTAIALKRAISGEEILPCQYSNNYISILPSEKKNISVFVARKDITEKMYIDYKPYNSTVAIKIPLK